MKLVTRFFPKLVILALLIVSISLVACSSSGNTVSSEPTADTASDTGDSTTVDSQPTEAPADTMTVVKVGAAHALSGPIALYGTPIKQGIELAVKEINEQHYLGDNMMLEVVYEDTAGDKEQAISVFEKLVNQDHVVAILGPTLSNSAFAADPVAQEAGIPVIGSSNTATGITDMGEYVFRTSLPESAVIPNTIAVMVAKNGLERVAVMYGNDDQFTQSGYEVFATALADSGIEILSTDTFAKGDTDFSAQLTKIKNLEPQAIVASALAEEAANIMLQARQLGIADSIYFIGGNGFNSPKLAEIAGASAEGAVSGAAWFISNPTPENEAFVAAYQEAYGADPDQFAAQAYTAAWVLAKAIKDAGSAEPAAIRDALANIKDFPTPLGNFSFDANRDPVHTPVVLVVKDGKFALFGE